MKAKEERIKCVTEHTNEKIITKRKIIIKCRNEISENQISEAIKNIDSRRNSEEYAQNKCGANWEHVDIDARDSFLHSTASMIKCAVGVSMHGERIKLIDKRNKNTECTTFSRDKPWEYEILCKTNKNIRDDFIVKLRKD